MIDLIITVVFTAIFCVIFAKRNAFQFLELDAKTKAMKGIFNSKWHSWEALLRLTVGVAIACYTLNIWLAGVYLALVWFFFDGFINWVRNKGFLYVGGGSIDGFFKDKFGDRAGGIMLVVKLLAVLTSILLYIFL